MKTVPIELVNLTLDGVKSVSDDNSIHMMGKTDEQKELIRHIVSLCAIPVEVLIKNA